MQLNDNIKSGDAYVYLVLAVPSSPPPIHINFDSVNSIRAEGAWSVRMSHQKIELWDLYFSPDQPDQHGHPDHPDPDPGPDTDQD